MATWIEHPAAYDDKLTAAQNRLRPRGIVRCPCSAPVSLDDAVYGPDYAAACDRCGQLFNLSGQELRPKREWEEPLDE